MIRITTILFIIFIGLFSAPFSYAENNPVSDLQSLIRDLQVQIQTLQAQVKTLEAELGVKQEPAVSQAPSSAQAPSAVSPQAPSLTQTASQEAASQPQSELTPPDLIRSLSKGSSGDDVRKLQEFLAKDKEIYPEGLITGFFGPRTEEAVKKWQQKQGIESVGIVGPKTIARFKDIGKGVIQGLLSQGAGQSNIIPPGLFKKAESPITPTPSGTIPAQPISQTGTTTIPAIPQIPTQISTTTSTTTPSGTIPATPAVPAQPATGVVATPAVPAQPAIQTTTTASSTTATPSFIITSPNGGEQWIAGNTYTVTWTSAGTAVSKVNIEVYKSGVYSTAIAYDTANTGSINWTIPATFSTGSDYKIRVYNIAYSNNFDESNSAFNITVPTTAPATPPIGYWKFDGSGNNEINGSPNSAIVGNASFKTTGGKFNGYLYMPAGTDYAKIPYDSRFNLTNLTVEFWFRQRSNQSFQQNFVYKGTPINNYNFNVFRRLWNEYNYGEIIAGSTAASTGYWHQASNSNNLAHNEWHHVVYTRSTTDIAYYLDGVTVYSGSLSSEYAGAPKMPAVDIIIGNPAPDTDIDNLRIYNYALSRGEVLYNYAENISGSSGATASGSAPVTPASLTYSLTNSNRTVILNWTDNSSNETRFEILRRTSGGSFAYIGQVGPNVTTFSDSPSAGTYDYDVQACNGSSIGAGCSNNPPPVTVTVGGSTSDAIPPSVPTGVYLSTPAAGSSSVNLYWTASTDNVAVAGYKVYQNGSFILEVSSTLPTSVGNLSSSYSYSVAAFDASGNISAQSASASVPVPSSPTNIQAVTSATSQSQPPQIWYYVTFDYTLQSTTQSFNMYRKRPTDASFVKYTYSAQTPVNASILPLPASDQSNLYHRYTNQWQWWTTLPAPVPDTAVGEYSFYVTATDTNGMESASSETKTFKLYAAPTITSPAEGATVSAPFNITVSGDPAASSPSYGMIIYKKTTGDTAWSAWPPPSTNFTYTGPVLNASDNPHRLVVLFSSGSYDRSLFGTSVFNISTTTASFDSRAEKLAAISKALKAINEKLLKLLQGL